MKEYTEFIGNLYSDTLQSSSQRCDAQVKKVRLQTIVSEQKFNIMPNFLAILPEDHLQLDVNSTFIL